MSAEAARRTPAPRPNSTRRAVRLLAHRVRHVRTTHQRAAEHHPESQAETVIAVLVETRGLHELDHGQIAPRGLQILAYGCDVRAVFTQIAQQLPYLVGTLAEPHHEARFHQHL